MIRRSGCPVERHGLHADGGQGALERDGDRSPARIGDHIDVALPRRSPQKRQGVRDVRAQRRLLAT